MERMERPGPRGRNGSANGRDSITDASGSLACKSSNEGTNMTRATQVPDRTITQQATQKLANRGIRSPCHVNVQSRGGDVTLSGTVQFAHQKGAAAQVVGGIS